VRIGGRGLGPAQKIAQIEKMLPARAAFGALRAIRFNNEILRDLSDRDRLLYGE